MTTLATILDTLEATARSAGAAEAAFRREAAERIKTLERERSHAFRRLNLLRPIVEAVARAESEEMAVAGSQAILRAKLGWSDDSEARSTILTRFAAVVKGMFTTLHPPSEGLAESVDILALLGAFEAWYEVVHRASFWDLLDQPMQETPVVDF
jgi:hypothetical protein